MLHILQWKSYLYITFNKKILFVKKYLSLLWVFTDFSPFFLLLSEHKHCDNAATNSNSENARSRMVAILRGNVGTGTKGDESSTGCVWAAVLHHVTARSRLSRALKLMNRLFLSFSKFFSGRSKARITETADTESVDTGVRLYVCHFHIQFKIQFRDRRDSQFILSGSSIHAYRQYHFILYSYVLFFLFLFVAKYFWW
jgi:hypothetical protein